ncbi:hypothetical protein U3516DRAFT_745808 [Neocallimastix sp. 'constans']
MKEDKKNLKEVNNNVFIEFRELQQLLINKLLTQKIYKIFLMRTEQLQKENNKLKNQLKDYQKEAINGQAINTENI